MSDIDMSQFTEAKSDQITADDLVGSPRTITITKVSGNEGNNDQPINIYYEGDNGKPFRPCKTVRRVMVKVWGIHAATYQGKSMTLYCDPTVTWAGMQVGGVRISHMSDIDAPVKLALAESQKKRKVHVIQPLVIDKRPDPAVHLPALEAAADLGMDALKNAWESMKQADRIALESHLPTLKDRAGKVNNDEPETEEVAGGWEE